MSKIKHIYLDMDGVLADFDGGFSYLFGRQPKEYEAEHGSLRFWELIYSRPTFFSELSYYPHALELVRQCVLLAPTSILSSPSKTNQPLCMLQKRAWVDRVLGPNFPALFEGNKARYAAPDRLLIDDTPKKIAEWEAAGGIGYLFDGNVDKLMDMLTALTPAPAPTGSEGGQGG